MALFKLLKQSTTKLQVNEKSKTSPTNLLKLCAMTNEINYELMSELIFTNEEIFEYIDIDMAKIVACLCKNARLNKNVQLAFDRFKVREYFDKIFDVITQYIMYIQKSAYLIRENITENNEYSITAQFDEIIDDLNKENENVIDGFRELIVLEYKEFIYNYENCGEDIYDIQYNLDYCDQYFHIVEYFGYYEYCESHTYDPTHFVLTPDKMDYDFVRAL